MTSRLSRHLRYRRRRVGVWWRSRVFLHPAPKRAVWVTSWQRSGSTWLAEQLASAPRTRFIYEPVNVPDGIVTGKQAALQPVPTSHPEHVNVVLQSLAGRATNHWVDQMNRSHFPRRTVVKDVRGIELISDVRTRATATPIVVLVRHPFAVAASVVRLGWYDPSLTPRQAFVQEVERWCASHERALVAWRSLLVTDPLTHWTTYEELTAAFPGDTIDDVTNFLVSHDATWNALASRRSDLAQRSATDFAGEAVAIEDEWRAQAFAFLVASGWDHLYNEQGSQRISIAQFLANVAK